MPGNIAQYNSPIDKLQPSEVGAEALARAGRTIGGLYSEAGNDYRRTIDQVGGQINAHEALVETTQGAAVLAAMHNNFTTQWQSTLVHADPNDKSIQGTFLDNTVEPQLQQFEDGFVTKEGQEWAAGQANQMRQHYAETTSGDMSTRQGMAVKEDMRTALTNWAATAHTDWRSIDATFGQIDATVAGIKEHSAGTLTAAQLNQMDDLTSDAKNEVVKSGMKGLADQTPAAVAPLLDSGKFNAYLSPDEVEGLKKYAKTAAQTKLDEQNNALSAQKQAQGQYQDNVANQTLIKNYNQDTGTYSFQPGTLQAIMTDPQTTVDFKLKMRSMINKVSSGGAKDDTATVQDIFKGMGDGTASQETVFQAASEGNLSPNSFKFFSALMKQTPDAVATRSAISKAMEGVQATIAPLGVSASPLERREQAAFTNWFLPAYQSAQSDPAFEGLSQSQIAQRLLSSTDPKGLLTPENLARFTPSPRQALANGMQNVGPLPPGLSIAPTRAPASNTDYGYGKRQDGTNKGQGYFGPLPLPSGKGIATEYSVGIDIGGKELEVPSLVPTLTREEVSAVLQAASEGRPVPPQVIKKATDYAAQRIAAGKSPFAQPGEQNLGNK